jgi:hypothetical protein
LQLFACVANHGDQRAIAAVAELLLLLLQGWLGRNDTVLHQGEGPIRAVAWQGAILVWASDVGVKVRTAAACFMFHVFYQCYVL